MTQASGFGDSEFGVSGSTFRALAVELLSKRSQACVCEIGIRIMAPCSTEASNCYCCAGVQIPNNLATAVSSSSVYIQDCSFHGLRFVDPIVLNPKL